jgi:tRNA(fMet)-specific endonuclease VapC
MYLGGVLCLSPLVLSELLSGAKKTSEQNSLIELFLDLERCECSLEHWIRVGKLRHRLLKLGFAVSTPDAHVFQCALDCDGDVLSEDKIFTHIVKKLLR